MRSLTTATLGRVLLCLFLFGAAGPAAEAESIGRGRYRGVYHVDRWSRPTFDILSVAPALHARLAPLQGRNRSRVARWGFWRTR
jgi:hypothetical protein